MERARPDHYRVLQVDPAANPLVIQAAYRVLAQIWHPDVSGDDAEMKRINAAWEVLGDPRRRKQYDVERAGRHPGVAAQTGSHSTSASAAPAAPPASGGRTADVNAAFAAQSAGRGAPSSAGSPGTSSPAPAEAAPMSGDHAGPPVGEPFGPVLRFGRYEGWTLGQVSRIDRAYLEWLRSAPAGRGLRDEIDSVLRSGGISGVDRRRYDSDRQRQVHTWAPGAPTRVR